MIALLFALIATVPVTNNSKSYACDAVTATYAVDYPYLTSADLIVTSTTAASVVTTLSATTDYTLNRSSTTTTATLTLNSPATKCPVGSTLKILRSVAATQPYGFRAQTTYNPSLHETAYDRIMMIVQQTINGGAIAPIGQASVLANSPILGTGTTADHLRWDFSVANTWTAKQTITGGAGATGVVATGGTGNAPGGAFTGTGNREGLTATAGNPTGTNASAGVIANGGNATGGIGGLGIIAQGGTGTTGGGGGQFAGGAPNGVGVRALADGNGAGVYATASSPVAGSPTTGAGVSGFGGVTNGPGIEGHGKGTGVGAWGFGASYGVRGDATAANGVGVTGNGGNCIYALASGAGGRFGGDCANSGTGVEGIGGAPNGIGGVFVASGSGAGLTAIGGPSGVGDGATLTGGSGGGAGVTAIGGATNGGGGVFSGGAGSGSKGVVAYGGGTNGRAVEANPTGTGEGVAAFAASGPAIYATATSGLGGIFYANATRGSLNIVPRSSAPSTPSDGELYAHSTVHSLNYYNGTVWHQISGNPVALAISTAGATLNNNSATTVVYGTEETDSDSAYDNTTGIFTAPTGKGGTYFISCTIAFAATFTPGTNAFVRVKLSGTVKRGAVWGAVSLPAATTISTSTMVTVAAGQTLLCEAFQDSGSNRTYNTAAELMNITIKRIGD